MQILCIFLFKFGVISFRAIPRILEVMKYFYPFINKIYHFTSVINWYLKLGYYKLNNICKVAYEWTAIIDSSIKLGNNKLLLVLSVKTEIMKNIYTALTLKDVEIVGLFVKETINAETVRDSLKEVFVKTGIPRQIISDGGRELIKGSKLAMEDLKANCIYTLDIGHFSANVLRSVYEKNSQFIELIKFTSNLGLKLRQTIAGWIIPPKLRNKSRFQNISLLAYWVKEAFEYCQNHLMECDNKTRELLKNNFKGNEFLLKFSEEFYTNCKIMNSILEIIKNTGLSEKTFNDVMKILAEPLVNSKIRMKLESYFEENIKKLRDEKIDNLILSTDIIESVFGKIKYVVEKSPVKDFNRLSLLLPGLVGSFDEDMIVNALQEVKLKDIKKWENENIKETLLMKRRKEFSKVKTKKTTSNGAEDSADKVA